MIFDQKEIYEKVKDSFQRRGYDVEFGSNIQQIQNSMSYLVSMLNANTQVNVRETILSSQTKRNMILEGSRMLGYEAAPKRSFKYLVDIEVINPTGSQVTYTLGSYQQFTSGSNKYFHLSPGQPKSITIPASESRILKDVRITEGTLIRWSETPNLRHTIRAEVTNIGVKSEGYVDIPYNNVEKDGIMVSTVFTDVNGARHEQIWLQSDNYLLESDLDLTGRFIREDNIQTGTPRLYFKYGDWGTGLRVGTEVRATVLISQGQKGQIQGEVKFEDSESELQFDVDNVRLVTPGTDEESNASIKKNAPIFNNTANRVVTIHDYQAIQNRQSGVEESQIWDGFEEFEKLPGHIWFSFAPSTRKHKLTDTGIDIGNPVGDPVKNSKWVLEDYHSDNNYMESEGWQVSVPGINESDSEVQKIFKEIRKYSIPTLSFNFRQPVYLDFDMEVNVAQYNQQQPSSEQNNQIFNSISHFFNAQGDSSGQDMGCTSHQMERFKQKYFNSDLIEQAISESVEGTMFDIKPNVSVTLTSKHINIDEADTGSITFQLGAEFAPIVNDTVVISNLPNINTSNFLDGKQLTMPSKASDFTPVLEQFHGTSAYIGAIKLGEEIVGTYRVFGSSKTVEIQINATSEIRTGLEDGLKVNIKYPTPNISAYKNTIPRLNSVEILSGVWGKYE